MKEHYSLLFAKGNFGTVSLSHPNTNNGKEMTSLTHLLSKSEIVRFRYTALDDTSFIGEAQVDCAYGTGLTDEDGYTDDDETSVTLLTVFSEEYEQEIYPYVPGFPYALRSDLEAAALDHFYNPSQSMIVFPLEQESYFDGLVNLGKSEFALEY